MQWISGRLAFAAVLAAAAMSLGASRAEGCQTCSSELTCYQSSRGGVLCMASMDACVVAGRCNGSGPGPQFDDAFSMIQLTVLEDAPGYGAIGRARIVRGAGTIGVGREAVRLAREAAGGAAAEPEIVYSGVGSGDGATVAFRSRRGDGFTFRRDADGRGARVTIRSLVAGRPGPVIARERLEERDALVVRVTLEGRARILVVQTPTVAAAEGEALQLEALRALRDARDFRPPMRESPFELSAVPE